MYSKESTKEKMLNKQLHLIFKIPHDKLFDILYKVVDFVLKGGTRDYIENNKQGCASWLSKKRKNHFVFTKSLLK